MQHKILRKVKRKENKILDLFLCSGYKVGCAKKYSSSVFIRISIRYCTSDRSTLQIPEFICDDSVINSPDFPVSFFSCFLLIIKGVSHNL